MLPRCKGGIWVCWVCAKQEDVGQLEGMSVMSRGKRIVIALVEYRAGGFEYIREG